MQFHPPKKYIGHSRSSKFQFEDENRITVCGNIPRVCTREYFGLVSVVYNKGLWYTSGILYHESRVYHGVCVCLCVCVCGRIISPTFAVLLLINTFSVIVDLLQVMLKVSTPVCG